MKETEKVDIECKDESNEDDLVIDESNFDQYFFDARQHKPNRNQVLARYTAMAQLVEGNEKRNLLDLLSTTTKAEPAVQVMRKLFFATDIDAIRVCQAICQDMMELSYDEVLAKPYGYQAEMFYYTEPKYVPNDDPHWEVISLLNLDEFLDRTLKDIQQEDEFLRKENVNASSNQDSS